MKKIRYNTYETNSSSTHSIVIANEKETKFYSHFYDNFDKKIRPFDYDDSLLNLDKIIISGGYFGCDWRKTNDAMDKINYIAQVLYNCFYYEKSFRERISILVEVLKENTKCEIVLDMWEHGYVEDLNYYISLHLCGFEEDDGYPIYEQIDVLKQNYYDFIFNKNSKLFIGSDEYFEGYVNKFFDYPDTEYGYKLVIYGKSNNIEWFLKENEFPTNNKEMKEIMLLIHDNIMYDPLFKRFVKINRELNDLYNGVYNLNLICTSFVDFIFQSENKGVAIFRPTGNIYKNKSIYEHYEDFFKFKIIKL